MIPVYFKGATEIKKPDSMTDEQCTSVWAEYGYDEDGFFYFCTAWKPSKEDLEAINKGEPIYVKKLSDRLPPMSLFTIDKTKAL